MVNSPLIRPYFLGFYVALGGPGPLGSHENSYAVVVKVSVLPRTSHLFHTLVWTGGSYLEDHPMTWRAVVIATMVIVSPPNFQMAELHGLYMGWLTQPVAKL